MAYRVLAYRAWYVAPGEAEVPEAAILTDARLQRREHRRQLRRAQVGLFDSPPAHEPDRGLSPA
jgi:hypothetical protein